MSNQNKNISLSQFFKKQVQYENKEKNLNINFKRNSHNQVNIQGQIIHES